MMNRLQLFLLLRRHNWLAFRRSPAYEQSVVARVMMVLGAGMMMIYLIAMGTGFGSMASGDAPGILMLFMPVFLLLIDFSMRFLVQKTPAMLIKPYMLLPLPRRAVVDTFLITSLTSGYNWLWLSLVLPYCFIIYCGGASVATVLTVFISSMVLFLANSQFYLLVRTLIGRSLLWWVLPLVVYGSSIVLLVLSTLDADALQPLVSDFSPIATGLDDFLDAYIDAAEQLWFVLPCLALLLGLLWLNRVTQYHFAYDEVTGEERRTGAESTRVVQFTFLECFGLSGEYLKLELKSIMRNKAIRSRVFMSLSLIVMLTLLIAYTEMYDGRMMLNFWCFYCFSIYGMTALIKVMAPEGNYIDLLMTHRENILQLLQAKYYFHVAILFVPLILMLPAIIAGKFTLLMVAAYMLLSSGFTYFLLFQMAVYNKQSLPLNDKITGKNNMETGLQLVIELAAMFLPMVLVALLILLFDEDTAYCVMAVIGALFTLSHPLWLRNIYVRMMARKYENLEGFHASR